MARAHGLVPNLLCSVLNQALVLIHVYSRHCPEDLFLQENEDASQCLPFFGNLLLCFVYLFFLCEEFLYPHAKTVCTCKAIFLLRLLLVICWTQDKIHGIQITINKTP